ncbi:MAG: GIY-YIG nuclease family protein [Pseudomonadota bacterium]
MHTKEEIIAAIKQAAKKNADKPLGQEAFETQTGIKISEWRNIYWVRWSDALKDAGFSPNIFNQRKDTKLIFDKLIEAVRYYKKIPTIGELRFYKNTVDSEFPSHGTINNHFQTKSNLVAKLYEYTSEIPEFEDIFYLCKEIDVPEKQDDIKSNLREGDVYLFKSGNHYKIGNSYNLEQRVKQIRTQMPDSLMVIHAIKTDDPFGIEAYWHNRFKDKRKNGEWFELSLADIKAFKRRNFQ